MANWYKIDDNGAGIHVLSPREMAALPPGAIDVRNYVACPLTAVLVAHERRRLRQHDPDDRSARPAWTPETALASALANVTTGTPFGVRS